MVSMVSMTESQPVKIVLHHERSLKKYGYEMHAPASLRHAALERAVHEYGPTYLIKKLNVLYIYHKNIHKELGKIARSNMHWVQKHLKGTIGRLENDMKFVYKSHNAKISHRVRVNKK
jgi:Family of unknown function (DUF5771)